jgi:hypothetical protein
LKIVIERKINILNNSKTELIAVGRIKDAILESDILEPYIDDNDKTPSWDGNIFVYKSPEINKKNLKGKVPLQVKGTKVEKFSDETMRFSFDIADLRNYLNDGGALFFAVEIIDSKSTKIFYKSLLPMDIKQLLSESKVNQKTILSTLNFLDNSNIKHLENICFNFLYHREFQYSTVNHSKYIENFKTITFTVFPGDIEPNKYILEHEIYIYGKQDENSIPIPIDKVAIETITRQMLKQISINSKVYFDTYIVVESKKESHIVIGKNIKFSINTGKIDFKSAGSLNERLKDAQFLDELFNSKVFYIGDIKIKSSFISDNEMEKVREYLKYLNEIMDLLKFFNIKEDLDIDNLDKQDYDNINFLIAVVLYNRKIKSKSIEAGMSHIKVGNIDIAAFIILSEDRTISIYNYFSTIYKIHELIICFDDDEIKSRGSIFLILKVSDITKASNLDLQVVEDSIRNIPLDDINTIYITFLVLELIKAYDTDEKLKDCLYTAHRLCELLEEFDVTNKVYKINRIQIIKRLRILTREEMKELMDIRASSGDSTSILCAVSILLENKSDFEFYFESLSNLEREEFMGYPIYNFTIK